MKENNFIIKNNIEILEKNEKEVMKSLNCNFCGKLIVEPVTVIPCGHNFCLGCKKAYTKECIKCGPKVIYIYYKIIIQVKIEAMYRNELLDDILNIMKIMQGTRNCLNGMLDSTNK